MKLRHCFMLGTLATLLAHHPLAAHSADLRSVAPEVRRSVGEMSGDLSIVRFYSGTVVLVPGGEEVGGAERSRIRIRFSVGMSDEAVRVNYVPEHARSRIALGLPYLQIDSPQSRFYDSSGAAVVSDDGRYKKRLNTDHSLENWASKEWIIGSPELIGKVLGSLGPHEHLARPMDSLGIAGWGGDADTGDRYVYCPPLSGTSDAKWEAHEHYANLPRHIRFAARFDYRPDLIVLTLRGADSVWECWRITWTRATVDGHRIWFPSSVRQESYNPLVRWSSRSRPVPLWVAESTFDLASLSTRVPFSLTGPQLPPGAAPRVDTSRVQRVSRERIAEEFARDMSIGPGVTVPGAGVIAPSNVRSEEWSTRIRVVLLATAILVVLIAARFGLPMLRRIRHG